MTNPSILAFSVNCTNGISFPKVCRQVTGLNILVAVLYVPILGKPQSVPLGDEGTVTKGSVEHRPHSKAPSTCMVHASRPRGQARRVNGVHMELSGAGVASQKLRNHPGRHDPLRSLTQNRPRNSSSAGRIAGGRGDGSEGATLQASKAFVKSLWWDLCLQQPAFTSEKRWEVTV